MPMSNDASHRGAGRMPTPTPHVQAPVVRRLYPYVSVLQHISVTTDIPVRKQHHTDQQTAPECEMPVISRQATWQRGRWVG